MTVLLQRWRMSSPSTFLAPISLAFLLWSIWCVWWTPLKNFIQKTVLLEYEHISNKPMWSLNINGKRERERERVGMKQFALAFVTSDKKVARSVTNLWIDIPLVNLWSLNINGKRERERVGMKRFTLAFVASDKKVARLVTNLWIDIPLVNLA